MWKVTRSWIVQCSPCSCNRLFRDTMSLLISYFDNVWIGFRIVFVVYGNFTLKHYILLLRMYLILSLTLIAYCVFILTTLLYLIETINILLCNIRYQFFICLSVKMFLWVQILLRYTLLMNSFKMFEGKQAVVYFNCKTTKQLSKGKKIWNIKVQKN